MKRGKPIRRIIWGLPVLLCLAIGILIFLRLEVGPLVQDLARARVTNRGAYIINEATEALLLREDVDYRNIISLEKDDHGNVTALKTNINEINRLKTKILSEIDALLLELGVEEVGIPLGSLILPEIFSGAGPRLPVKVLAISRSDAGFENRFTEAGINQTAHRIMMNVEIQVTVLTPAGTEKVEISSSVVVAETVIVGQVPNSYIQFQGER